MEPFLPLTGRIPVRDPPYPAQDQLQAIQDLNGDVQTLHGRVAVLAGIEVRFRAHRQTGETVLVEAFIEFVSGCHINTAPDPECSQPVASLPSLDQEQ